MGGEGGMKISRKTEGRLNLCYSCVLHGLTPYLSSCGNSIRGNTRCSYTLFDRVPLLSVCCNYLNCLNSGCVCAYVSERSLSVVSCWFKPVVLI